MQVPRIFYAQCLSLSDTDGSPRDGQGWQGYDTKNDTRPKCQSFSRGYPGVVEISRSAVAVS